MGLRGPAPKPTAIRQLEGNPSNRPLPANEPKYAPASIAPPKEISRAAKRIWQEYAVRLSGSGVLRSVDRRALLDLCEDEAMLVIARKGIWKSMGKIETAAKAAKQELTQGPFLAMVGVSQNRLALAAVRDLAARVFLQRREFGLTPASRTRIDAGAGGGEEFDPLEMKLCG